MKFGVNVYVTDNGIDAVEAGRVTEDAGLDSIWLGDHSHIPADKSDVQGQDQDPHFVGCYSRFYDQYCALSAIAATTTDLKLGCGITIVPEHEPIGLAKQVATVDYMSGGRVLFGVGAGWNLQETRNHGVDPAKRFGVMKEHVLAMKEIWANDVAEYHGKYVDFSPLMSWPKPAQEPHPPIIMGGRGPKVIDRVFDYSDAWGPDLVGGMEPINELEPRITEFKQRCEEEGREVPMVAFGVLADEACVRRVEELGFDTCLISIPPGSADEIKANIEHAGKLAQTVAA